MKTKKMVKMINKLDDEDNWGVKYVRMWLIVIFTFDDHLVGDPFPNFRRSFQIFVGGLDFQNGSLMGFFVDWDVTAVLLQLLMIVLVFGIGSFEVASPKKCYTTWPSAKVFGRLW